MTVICKTFLPYRMRSPLKIVTALRIKLTEGEQARMWGKKAKNLDIYLKGMEALSLFRKGTKESLIRFGQ